MNKITFIGQTNSSYLFGKGRGKDKTKRKRKIINTLKGAGLGLIGGTGGLKLAGATMSRKELIPITVGLSAATLGGAALGNVVFDSKTPIKNARKDKSSVATNSTALLGAALGAKQAAKHGINPATGALMGGLDLASIGMNVDRQVTKEKARYKQEGARPRLGKISNDAKTGAKSVAGLFATKEAIKQLRRPGSLKTKTLKTVGGAVYGGIKGSVIGGGIGISSGITRGFPQPNKKKK